MERRAHDRCCVHGGHWRARHPATGVSVGPLAERSRRSSRRRRPGLAAGGAHSSALSQAAAPLPGPPPARTPLGPWHSQADRPVQAGTRRGRPPGRRRQPVQIPSEDRAAVSGGRGLCAGLWAGRCGACVLARVADRWQSVRRVSRAEAARPEFQPAPHRNSPWSDRRGLAGGAAGHWSCPVPGAGEPEGRSRPKRPLRCQPLPHALLLPSSPKVASVTLGRARDLGPPGPLPPTGGSNSGSCEPGSSAGPARPVSARFASANSGSASKDICPVEWPRGRARGHTRGLKVGQGEVG